MNNADRQLLDEIRQGPSGADVRVLARMVESLCERVETLEQQQRLPIDRLQRIADSFAHIAYERAERLPVDGLDWLDPNRGMADEVPSAQRFPSSDELREFAGLWVAVKDGAVVGCNYTLAELHGWLNQQGLTADSVFGVPPEASVDADRAEVTR